MSEAEAERDADWEQSHLYGLFEEISMCGCGWGDDAYVLIRDLLDHFHDRDNRNVVEMIGSTGAAQLVLRRLDVAGLTDHGTSITSSWVTEKGRYARHLMHKHAYADLDHTGYPDCFDHERDCCPDECWVPTADVPPEPPRPSTEELMARIKAEADDALARMDPISRAIHQAAAARTESAMLFGTPDPPEVVGELGALARNSRFDFQAEADRLRAQIEAAEEAMTTGLLRQYQPMSPETADAVRRAAKEAGVQPGGLD